MGESVVTPKLPTNHHLLSSPFILDMPQETPSTAFQMDPTSLTLCAAMWQNVAFEKVIIKLQDIVLEYIERETTTVAKEEALQRLSAVMHLTPETRRLEISSQSKFNTNPARTVLPASYSTAPIAEPTPKQEPIAAPVFQEIKPFFPTNWSGSDTSDETDITTVVIEDLRGKLLKMSMDKSGIKCIKWQLRNADGARKVEIVGCVLGEIGSKLSEVSTSDYGQYLVSKLAECASTEQRTIMINILCPHILQIAKDIRGSHTLQSIIPFLNTQQACVLATAMTPCVSEIAKDNNGKYVLIAFADQFGPGPCVQFLFDMMCAQPTLICCNKHSYMVVCKCLASADSHQLASLIKVVIKNANKFINEYHGNYIMQYILTECPIEQTRSLIHSLYGSIGMFCCKKYSSNVIEKCFQAADLSTFQHLVDEIAVSTTLAALIVNPYGNFVVQKVLDLATPAQQTTLASLMQPILKTTTGNPYVLHIQKKLAHL